MNSIVAKKLPRFPYKLYHQEGKLYVHEDLSDEQHIGAGSEIIGINGKSVRTYSKKKCWEMITTDGYNSSMPYDAISIAFSRYYAYFFETPTVFKIDFIDANGQIKTSQIKGLKATILNEKRKQLRKVRNDKPIIFTIKENIGYLKIASFQPENAGKFKKTIKNAFVQLASKNISNLIIDVRRNGGGYGEAADVVLRYLIKETVLGTRMNMHWLIKFRIPNTMKRRCFLNTLRNSL